MDNQSADLPLEQKPTISTAIDSLRSGRDSLIRALEISRDRLPPTYIARMEMLLDLNNATLDLTQTTDVLWNDLQEVLKPGGDILVNQGRRREAYRVTFAWIEGTVFMMKQFSLKAAPIYGVKLSSQELAIISEKQARLDERGQIKLQTAYPDTKANVRFAFRLMAQSHGVTFQLDTGGQGWQDFQKTHKVRNRITHPKSLANLEVTDSELFALIHTIRWLSEQITQVLSLCRQAQDDLGRKFDIENKALLSDMLASYQEPIERIARIEQVSSLLDKLRQAQIDDGQWDEQLTSAKDELAAFRQYFTKQLPKPK